MLKKSITYTDFNGEKRTEDFYFNLSRAELTEMQMSVNGGMSEYLQKIINSQDNTEIFNTFKTISFLISPTLYPFLKSTISRRLKGVPIIK